jgi:hypothetical protein
VVEGRNYLVSKCSAPSELPVTRIPLFSRRIRHSEPQVGMRFNKELQVFGSKRLSVWGSRNVFSEILDKTITI